MCPAQANIESENPFPIHSLPRVSSNSTSYTTENASRSLHFTAHWKLRWIAVPHILKLYDKSSIIWNEITCKFCWKCASCFCPGVLLVVLNNEGGKKSSNDFWNMPYIHLVCSSLYDFFYKYKLSYKIFQFAHCRQKHHLGSGRHQK